MTAAEPWVLFCDHEKVDYSPDRPCSNTWTVARKLDDQWHARLLASADGWTFHEHDPASMLTARDYCPEHTARRP